MSCDRQPTSTRQAAGFDDLQLGERQLALAHFAICPACRSAALAVDPSLLFSLGLNRAVAEESPDREAERMRSSVEALRRAESLKAMLPGTATRIRRAAAAVAAVLVAAALFLSTGAGRLASGPDTVAVSRETAAESLFATTVPETDEIELSAIEELDRPLARVYQLTEEDLSLVMIVDETFDI